jgi:hypothetical protein
MESAATHPTPAALRGNWWNQNTTESESKKVLHLSTPPIRSVALIVWRRNASLGREI